MEYTESIHDALYTLEYRLIPTYMKNDLSYKMDSVESLSVWVVMICMRMSYGSI